jgi:hypothetical protein
LDFGLQIADFRFDEAAISMLRRSI